MPIIDPNRYRKTDQTGFNPKNVAKLLGMWFLGFVISILVLGAIIGIGYIFV